MRTTRTLIVMFLCCFALSVAASPADPHVGTWKLNVAKSKYSPGPAPKEVTMKIEAKGEVFNLFNRSNLGSVDSGLADSSFGKSTSQLPSRSLQLHLRASF